MGLLRLCAENGMKMKENQKDCAIRILEYVVKKWNKIPTRSEQYLALGIVDLFAHFSPSKIHELGSIYVGLTSLSEFYFSSEAKVRMDMVIRSC